MFCNYIRFILKPKAASNSLESPSTLGEVLISEQTSFKRSNTLLLESWKTSRESTRSLVTLKREVVIELSIEL